MVNPFKKPYKEVESSREKFVSILIFGLFIFLFLFFFKPFGLDQLKPVQQFFITLGFGLVTTFMLFIFKYLLEPVVSKNNWTLGKSILWVVFIASSIGVANYFYITIIYHQIFVFKYLLLSIWTALLVGSIPVTITYIIAFNRIYKTALKEAAIHPEEILWESEVIIRAGNQKNEFKFNPKNIIYICSNDNYVTIVTIKGTIVSKTHLRGTLKAAESELKMNSNFIRCHKCFIVNAEYIDHVSGNFQNMRIKLNTPGMEIPVSRSKAASVIKKIK
jgi:DNA-binding LytR/AlgR family response regulator